MTTKKEKEPPIGIVVESHGSFYKVQWGDSLIQAVLRGKFRKEKQRTTNPVVVGDYVELRMEKGQGVIQKILPRKNELARPSSGGKKVHVIAANLDQALIVTSPKEPKVSFGLVDRILVACQAFEIPPVIWVNKTDLASPEELEEYQQVYHLTGFPLYFGSARTKDGLEDLKQVLSNKVTLFVGPSGVGKSTLLNALEPGLHLRTGEVSSSTHKGKHTTTYTSLLRLSFGGYVVDSPGMREFELPPIPKEELAYYFPEMVEMLGQCKFNNCQHLSEPGCAMHKWLEEKKIHPKRYKSYCNMLESLENIEN
ncbi:MAG: ribosome small subunit-dependent GTPase A [Planctomycetota bacterium]|nr:MAG: ribosome small subunit-dependent GTPase A [Planctomycetota bacterium]